MEANEEEAPGGDVVEPTVQFHRLRGSRFAEWMRAKDWRATPIGPRFVWHQSLYTYVRILGALPTPAAILWGPDYVRIYNEAYAPLVGARHPELFGATLRESLPESCVALRACFERMLDENESAEIGRTLVRVLRDGIEADAYFTFALVPLLDDKETPMGVLELATEVS